MTARAFTISAAAPQPYIFDLDREVAGFYRAHPEQKKRIFYIDASEVPGSLYRGDEKDLVEAATFLGHNPGVFEINQLAYNNGSRSDLFPKLNYGCVLLNFAKKSQQRFLGYAVPESVSQAFTFDHETAHLLCEKGLGGSETMNESVADAYATLRLIQRFGKDSAAIRGLIDKRAVYLTLCDDGDHFTGPVIEKIIADSRTEDFSKLSPADTVARAQKYAEDNIMDPALIKRMTNDFSILGAGAEDLKKGDFSVIKYLADFALHPAIAAEAKWAAVAVRALLDGDTALFGARLPKPTGAAWDKLRRDIKNSASTSAQPQRKKLIVGSR